MMTGKLQALHRKIKLTWIKKTTRNIDKIDIDKPYGTYSTYVHFCGLEVGEICSCEKKLVFLTSTWWPPPCCLDAPAVISSSKRSMVSSWDGVGSGEWNGKYSFSDSMPAISSSCDEVGSGDPNRSVFCDMSSINATKYSRKEWTGLSLIGSFILNHLTMTN